MPKIILVRLAQVIPTLFGVSLIAFVLVRLTGDPAATMLPPTATASEIAEFRTQYGLDLSWPAQYMVFLKNVVTGSLGTSIRYDVPVTSLLADRLPATLALGGTALAFAVVLGLSLGILSAMRQGTWVDRLARSVAMTGQAVPTFYLGILLILVFGVWLSVFPTGGFVGPGSLVLPSVALGIALTPLIVRVTRASMLDVVRQDYVRTAHAKGLPSGRILRLHVVRNALIPVITIVGLQLGSALSGAVLTETVFSWPGVGRLLVDAISTRDFPVVQGVVLVAAVGFVFVNILVDFLVARLDPRIKL
ncbi:MULTISPECIES: ABC transporter permease [Rhodococcus]|nr:MULTISPECIES: ABC transporter permease [Rhodococcus]MCQ4129071.1 ABC transporter permease [Rhodococcus erythropolis]MDJ0105225.1 ABC transporter permease [Rhodococcus erythropolis]MDV8015313.1 ABC transporter permease [Rhodococcus sp. IEGM 1241]